jgi:hypothetical protein
MGNEQQATFKESSSLYFNRYTETGNKSRDGDAFAAMLAAANLLKAGEFPGWQDERDYRYMFIDAVHWLKNIPWSRQVMNRLLIDAANLRYVADYVQVSRYLTGYARKQDRDIREDLDVLIEVLTAWNSK